MQDPRPIPLEGAGVSRPLRIALFSDSALPILNGVSISIRALVTELRNQGHSVHLYLTGVRDYRDTDPNIIRFFSLELPIARGYPLAIPPFYPQLLQFRKHEYDLIHTHTPFTVGFVGLRWAESHGLPIVSTYHTLYDRYAHYLPVPRHLVRYKIAKHTNYYYNRVNHVITPSGASRKWLRRHAVKTPVSVIPTGLPNPQPMDRAEVRSSLGIPPEHLVLLYVGRLAREKNLETLFQMAKRVFQENRFAQLWLVGDGPDRARCAEIVRTLNIGDRVRFVGAIPRDEVDRYYAAADLFVFSSISETQGLVVQEAMTYGLPTVAVVGGGAGAGIEPDQNGFLVKNDPVPFAEEVLRVIQDDGLYTRLSQGARQSVRAYTTAGMANRVIDIYNNILSVPHESHERIPTYR
jgi:1,2-diacylglycerol 3-alpha-glucosyltransferase